MRKQLITSTDILLLVIPVFFLGCGCPTSYPFHDDFTSEFENFRCEYRMFDQGHEDSYQKLDGQLKITASENQDLWGRAVTGGPIKRGAPLLLINAPEGRYRVEALVTATNTDSSDGPQALNTQVGLFVFQDVENWLFYGFTNHEFYTDETETPGDGLIVTVTSRGISRISYGPTGNDFDSAFLRLDKTSTGNNSRFQFRYRINENDPWIYWASEILFKDPGRRGEEVGMGVKTFNLSGSGVSNMGLGLFDEFLVVTD